MPCGTSAKAQGWSTTIHAASFSICISSSRICTAAVECSHSPGAVEASHSKKRTTNCQVIWYMSLVAFMKAFAALLGDTVTCGGLRRAWQRLNARRQTPTLPRLTSRGTRRAAAISAAVKSCGDPIISTAFSGSKQHSKVTWEGWPLARKKSASTTMSPGGECQGALRGTIEQVKQHTRRNECINKDGVANQQQRAKNVPEQQMHMHRAV